MNKWVKKSIKLANSRGYLDKLMDIYPANMNLARIIGADKIKEIERAFKKKDHKKLITVLLSLERFPIDNPYIGFFRKDRKSLDRNPKAVKQIGQNLLKMGFSEILVGASRAKVSSRQMGQMFRKWLYGLGYPVLSKNKFLNYKKIAILSGGDRSLKEFAREEFGYSGQKGLDLVLKIGNKFFIGEVKFITLGGGTQDKSFREAISFVGQQEKKVSRIALLDGVVWLVSEKTLKGKKKPNLYESVLKLKDNELVFSTLFLKEFIRSNAKKFR